MLRYTNKGFTINVPLPRDCGYKGKYSVDCTYNYDKEKDKYSLSMWLMRSDLGDKFKVDSQEIDTQYVSGTRETIKQNICKIVEQASRSGFFDYYVERLEYTCQCFDRGNDLYEQERLSSAS